MSTDLIQWGVENRISRLSSPLLVERPRKVNVCNTRLVYGLYFDDVLLSQELKIVSRELTPKTDRARRQVAAVNYFPK